MSPLPQQNRHGLMSLSTATQLGGKQIRLRHRLIPFARQMFAMSDTGIGEIIRRVCYTCHAFITEASLVKSTGFTWPKKDGVG